jgi:predicted type IV restriction endonuclease
VHALAAKLSLKRLETLVGLIDNFSKTSLTSSEANTKKKITEFLLDTLGWDTASTEVILEHPVKIGSTVTHVDYALTLEGKPVVLIEAKAFDTDLSSDHSAQIISYAKVEDVQWTVLTNGRFLKVFDAKAGKSEKECLVVEIDLRKLPAQAEELSLISRESILTGEIEAAAKRLASTKSAITNLKKNQAAIAEDFKNVLLNITGRELEKRVLAVSLQLAERTIELFEKETGPVSLDGVSKETQEIERKQLRSKPPGEVILCPSKLDGVDFLKKYNAWGFVALRKTSIPYFALYVGKPESSILYFGEVESITQPLKSKEDIAKISQQDASTFEIGKRVIHLKSGTLVKFKNPIPLKEKNKAPRGLRYTTLQKLLEANDLSEI